VADHPLRPANDRRLGRPLPHQLANRTQAPPQATLAFDPQVSCGISRSFPRLSPTQGQIPTRYSPVRHCMAETIPCDLHVLSMPPAFALSQDQTLRFIQLEYPQLPNQKKPQTPKPNKQTPNPNQARQSSHPRGEKDQTKNIQNKLSTHPRIHQQHAPDTPDPNPVRQKEQNQPPRPTHQTRHPGHP
jgi:hypothetical protein